MSQEKPPSALTFEQALARLESIVTSMEDGSVPLDKSIDLYEEGITLKTYCENLLKDYQEKVEKIVSKDERLSHEPLDKVNKGEDNGDLPF